MDAESPFVSLHHEAIHYSPVLDREDALESMRR